MDDDARGVNHVAERSALGRRQLDVYASFDLGGGFVSARPFTAVGDFAAQGIRRDADGGEGGGAAVLMFEILKRRALAQLLDRRNDAEIGHGMIMVPKVPEVRATIGCFHVSHAAARTILALR
jgi:hypothetical protein